MGAIVLQPSIASKNSIKISTMFKIILACVIVAVTSAIVCPPDACAGVKQEALNCKDGVLKNAGFCGCTDVCARVENEPCMAPNLLLGVPNTKKCDEGLVCVPHRLEGHENGHHCITQANYDVMVKNGQTVAVSRKSVPVCDTKCRKESRLCKLSMVYFVGQWFAECDQDGNFQKMQCDNTGHCFCVHPLTGEVQKESRVFGKAQC